MVPIHNPDSSVAPALLCPFLAQSASHMQRDPVQVAAWAGMATYLNTRIQATPEECGGRTPDFSLPAAEAFKAVLKEVILGSG